jgi:hypothetical protein
MPWEKSFTRLRVLAKVTLGKKTITQLQAYADYTVNGGRVLQDIIAGTALSLCWPHATVWQCGWSTFLQCPLHSGCSHGHFAGRLFGAV